MAIRFRRFALRGTSSSGTSEKSLLAASVLMFAVAASGCHPTKTAAVAESQSLESSIENAAELMDSVKCILPSPQWYRNHWLDINAKENALGRSLMMHYMQCSGTPYRLSEAEFRLLPVAIVAQELGPIYLSRDFISTAIAQRTGHIGDKIADIDDALLVSTPYGNTLGHFHMDVRGKLIWRKDESGTIVPHFIGQARIKDRYDFNPSESSSQNSWRGRDTELRVRIAHVGMPGRAFDIESDWFDFKFDYPKQDSDLIQESENNGKSGYSSYGEQLQLILMMELRSARWEKASTIDRFGILLRIMRRVHEAVKDRS